MNTEQIEQIKKALELSPDNPVLLRMYFGALKENKIWDEAEQVINKLIGLSPNELELQLELASVLYESGKLSQGILILEHLLSQGNEVPELLELLVKFYIKEDDYKKALGYYRRLKERVPGFSNEAMDGYFNEETGGEDEKELIRLGVEEVPAAPIVPLEKPGVSFKDVGGMAQVKEDISMKIINPVKHADLFKQYGKKIGGGILLYGPPGCGKTHIARATAGEIEASFISVGINDVMDMYLGQSEKQLHDIFEFARNSTPTVIFFDEVDALGASRNDMKNSAGRNIINQFLQELDGINQSNDGVLVLGATNAPWYIDNAFKRPGRFDRIIFIPPPDAQARKEILEILLSGKPKIDANLDKVAKATANFTGADLKALVDTAIEEKLKYIIKTGKELPIVTKDFLSVAKKIRPSSKEWFETAKNYAVYANHGGLYDDILNYLNIK